MSDARISQFGATFEVRQDCSGGERKEVNVATSVRRRPSVSLLQMDLPNSQSFLKLFILIVDEDKLMVIILMVILL